MAGREDYNPILIIGGVNRNSFCLAGLPKTNKPMKLSITNTDVPTLLSLYNQELDTLKAKLLNGESWENLSQHRKNITELAIAIHKNYSQMDDKPSELRHWNYTEKEGS